MITVHSGREGPSVCDDREKRKENSKIPTCTLAMLAFKRLSEFQRNMGTVTHSFPRASKGCEQGLVA